METFRADFSVADDMLQEAVHSRLAGRGQIIIEKSGRIGPIVEIALAARRLSDQYRSVRIKGAFAEKLHRSMITGVPFGNGYADIAGAFPLPLENPVTRCEVWNQWTLHVNNIARTKGFDAHLISLLIGALLEIQDNVYEHSCAPETGLVAYAVTENSLEFVVADGGVGVLNTLRQNPDYARISDSGSALQEVIKGGVSRFPSESGRGQGYNQLFRAMVGQNAEIRFRSGDHVLTLKPSDEALRGTTTVAQTAELDGLTVSVICRAIKA
jgi:hypothetical protein